MKYLFTSESVSEGHPDKVCDQISDTVLDTYLQHDKYARVALETMATTNRVIIAGETRSNVEIPETVIEDAIRNCIKNIGYDQAGFSWKNVQITNIVHGQSADIALGVDINGAGDQGIMFGYAKKEQGFDTEYMPLAMHLSNRILENLAIARHSKEISGLEPDAKSQVTLEYDRGIATGVKKIVVSTQHSADLSQADIRDIVTKYIAKSLPDGWMPQTEDILINPTGRFVIGGPDGDTGLTGRKIIVDNYGGYAPHGGGAFSGKDPTKVDRSAAYMLRYLAKNIVAAGLCDECTLQLSYAIGIAEPLSLFIDCKGTNKVDENCILQTIREHVDLTPRGIINHLNLRQPIYARTAAYGHFGRKPQTDGGFSWEKLDLVEEFKKCL